MQEHSLTDHLCAHIDSLSYSDAETMLDALLKQMKFVRENPAQAGGLTEAYYAHEHSYLVYRCTYGRNLYSSIASFIRDAIDGTIEDANDSDSDRRKFKDALDVARLLKANGCFDDLLSTI